MSHFGFILFPTHGTGVIQLFPQHLHSAIARFEEQLTPTNLRFRGRKRKYERHQLKIYRGDTETFVIHITLKDEPFDLTDFSITAQIREKPTSPDFIHQSAITDGLNGTILSQGHIVWVIPDTDTRNLPIKSLFDIRATLNGTVNTICSGFFERVDDITQT